MLFIRRVSRQTFYNVSTSSFLDLGAHESLKLPSKLNRQLHLKMIENLLQPPGHVKGMTILDKDQFTKTITVPCIYLPHSSIKDTQRPLKKYLLKLQQFRPLTEVTTPVIDAIQKKGIKASVKEGKMAILDPRKVRNYEDIADSDRSILYSFGINESNFTFIDFVLNYSHWKADEILRAIIPPEFDSVSGYSLIGHIVHLNLREHLVKYKQVIGNVLLDKIKIARTIVNKVDIIDNTYRNFQMEVLCGDNDMIVKVRENKCIFEFDFSEVYWNPRLCTEHERITEYMLKGGIVYDVFCGVGPFAIPAAKRGSYVLANDLNPHSIKWLLNNIKLNKVEKNIQVFNKDGHQFIREDIRKHILDLKHTECNSIYILMNLPALAPSFLRSFQNLFSDDEIKHIEMLPVPRVIVYCFVKGICNAEDAALTLIGSELEMEIVKTDNEVENIFFVRDVAPNKKMMRITLKLTRKILESRKRSSEHIVETEGSEPKKVCV